MRAIGAGTLVATTVGVFASTLVGAERVEAGVRAARADVGVAGGAVGDAATVAVCNQGPAVGVVVGNAGCRAAVSVELGTGLGGVQVAVGQTRVAVSCGVT